MDSVIHDGFVQIESFRLLMTYGVISITENSRAIHTSFSPICSNSFRKKLTLSRHHAKLYFSPLTILNFTSSRLSVAFSQTISCPLPVFILAFDIRYPPFSVA